MKVGILTHNYPINNKDRQNAGIFVYDLAQELQKEGNEVVVFCPGESNRKGRVGGIPVQWFFWKSHKRLGQLKLWNPLDLWKFLMFFYQGRRVCERFAQKEFLDVCIAMWVFPAGFFSLILRRRFNIPYVAWALGSDIYIYAKFPIIGMLIKRVLQEADYLFADGIDLMNRVTKISRKKCIFLPSASNLGKSQIGAFSPKKNKTKITLTFLGRMEKVKGPDILLSALINIKDVLPKFKIEFVGDGALLNDLKKLSKDENIAGFISFHGNVNNSSEIGAILQNSDWLIIPSRSDSIPLVFSEAMKSGTPVIASDLPDLKYLIDKYKIGYTFELNDIEHLSSIITTLPARKKDQQTFRKNTVKVAGIFNIEQSAKKINNVLSNLIINSRQT